MKGQQHPITDADLNAYLDGELSPERRDEVEAFLIAEPAQAARIETWRRQNEIVRAAFGKVAGESLPPSHVLALANPSTTRAEAAPRHFAPHAVEEPQHEVRRLGAGRSEQNRRIAGVTVAAFAAGALVTMLAAELSGMTAGLRTRPPAPMATPLTDIGRLAASRALEAYDVYAHDSLRPVEIDASQEPLLTSWLSQRVGFTILVPDLSSEGLKLLGARLTPGELGPAAFLLYAASDGSRVGLSITRGVKTDAIPRLHYVEERSASAVYWLDDGVARVLVGPAGRDRLMHIARRLAERPPPDSAR